MRRDESKKIDGAKSLAIKSNKTRSYKVQKMLFMEIVDTQINTYLPDCLNKPNSTLQCEPRCKFQHKGSIGNKHVRQMRTLWK